MSKKSLWGRIAFFHSDDHKELSYIKLYVEREENLQNPAFVSFCNRVAQVAYESKAWSLTKLMITDYKKGQSMTEALAKVSDKLDDKIYFGEFKIVSV